MGLITREVTIQAGQQFLGTEFSVAPFKPGNVLRLLEVNRRMGNESKTWEIRKTSPGGGVLTIQQSVDPSTGLPAASTDTDVLANGEQFATILEPGEQIQIVTTGATDAMRAKLYLEEVQF